MFLPQTLARRLLYTMLPWYLLLALSMTGFQLAIQYFTVGQAIVDDLASLGRTVEPGVTEAVWELDAARLTSVARGVRQNAIVTGVLIKTNEGDTLIADGVLPAAQKGQGGFFSGQYKQEVVPLFHPSLEGPRRQIGSLNLYSSRDVLWERTKYSLFMVLLNSAIVTTGLWLIFSWTIRFRLSDSVTRMARTVADWQFKTRDRLVDKIAYPYQDELGGLVDALNESRAQLFESMQNLKEVNSNLEKNIAERSPYPDGTGSLNVLDERFALR